MRRVYIALTIAALAFCFAVAARAQGFKRTMLQSTDFPNGYTTQLYLVEIAAGAPIPRHTHPGVETLYVLEGEIDFQMDGQTRKLKAGDSLQIPQGVAHGAPPSGAAVKVLSTYVIEKGKPLAITAEAK
jgi:quercetin dioxygenase-like cupin family protein